MKKNNLKTVVDLFAGAGGFSSGFEMAGMKIIGGIEKDKWAAETLMNNHKDMKVIMDDIKEVSNEVLVESFGSPDVIIGGPPCQGFSIANKNSGDSKDPRNSLFIEFLRAVKVLKPKVVVMENVPNLIKAKTANGEKVIDIIENELKALGYEVESKILEAVKYGVPQIRKRLFVIGTLKKLEKFFPEEKYTEEKYINLWDAISDLPEIEAREGAEELEYTKDSQNEFQSKMRKESTIVLNHKAMKHTKRMVERFKVMNWGESTKDVPDELKPYQRGNKGKISENIYDQNNRRMHPDKPCHTIAASFYANFVHPFKDRNFTAREGARIQTFPDNYKFYGKPTVVSKSLLKREGREGEAYLCQYNQIGNAVPPLLAKEIALNLIKHYLED